MHRLDFITSNRIKLIHAQFLARNYDVEITPKRNYGVAYEEPRSSNREYVLEKSFDDACARWKKTVVNRDENFFFIEDTSVIIRALSGSGEFPGLDVKYWMRDITFDKLDTLLKRRGNDRHAAVRSDVVLYLPNWLQKREASAKPYKVFTNIVEGAISDKEFRIATNPLFPWLDDRSFNRWFIPEGCRVPLSKLSIAQAEKSDFRAGSIKQMLEYLRQLGVICERSPRIPRPAYLPFPDRNPVFVICGLPCVGKTTLGEFLATKGGFYHLEASDFMWVAYLQRHGANSAISIEQFAEQALIEKPEIVVDKVTGELARYSTRPVVITGFRSEKELSLFRSKYSGAGKIEEFYLEAPARTRFARSRLRDRLDHLPNFGAFRERDLLQMRMGLTRIKSMLSQRIIHNEHGKEEFLKRFVRMAKLNLKDALPLEVLNKGSRPKSLAQAVLLCMAAYPGEAFTTTQIAHQIDTLFQDPNIKTSKNNVSRYFNLEFRPYFKLRVDDGKRLYRISATGLSKARLMLRISS